MAFRRRRSRGADVSNDIRDGVGRPLSGPEPLASIVGDSPGLDVDDFDRILWRDNIELDVIGRGGGVDGVICCDSPRGEPFVEADTPDRDGDDADADVEEL